MKKPLQLTKFLAIDAAYFVKSELSSDELIECVHEAEEHHDDLEVSLKLICPIIERIIDKNKNKKDALDFIRYNIENYLKDDNYRDASPPPMNFSRS